MLLRESLGLGDMKDVDPLLLRPIPSSAGQVAGWDQVLITNNADPLIPIGIGTECHDLYSSGIYAGERTDSPYYHNPYPGSLITVFLRQQVAQQLTQAQNLLPSRYRLVIYDGYRPLQVQREIYYRYHLALKRRFPRWQESRLALETQKYVSFPSHDDSKPPPHSTGGAVDVALVKIPDDIAAMLPVNHGSMTEGQRLSLSLRQTSSIARHGKLLEFGTRYDYGGTAASLAYYERLSEMKPLSEKERRALINRRLLYNVMNCVGMKGYSNEWWHFNSDKTQMGAITAGYSHAEYGRIELDHDHLTHEESRKKLNRSGARSTSIQKAAALLPPRQSTKIMEEM